MALAVGVSVVLGGCAAPGTRPAEDPDPELTTALAQTPVVTLRGPDNPTLDPKVLATFWDSARVRGATPAQATPPPTPPITPHSGPPITPAPTPGQAGARPFAQARLVRSPTGPTGGPGLGTATTSSPPTGSEVADIATAPVFDPAAQVLAARTTGRLFFTISGQPRSCTATVVASGSGSVLATAGHCLLADTPATGGGTRPAASNFLFGPGYHDGVFPSGRWTVESVHIPAGWSAGLDWSQDVGFLRVARQPDTGNTIQAAVGAQGLVFTDPTDPTDTAASGTTAVLGYPAVPPFDGATLRWCATTQAPPPDTLDPAGLAIRCAMTPGYSGGPALAAFDPSSGAGYLVAVASHDYTTGTLYGPRLGPAALDAYREADRG